MREALRRWAAFTCGWRHLGADNVRRQFKGMVERCSDCGFDLAEGNVEVVPTAHYMMGGVVFAPDCTTDLSGLFAAGEDTGGVHGANRLGGNGVANSTVFGGIAGDTMAAWVARSTRACGARRARDCRRRRGVRGAVRAAAGAISRRSARACTPPCGTTSASCAIRDGLQRAQAALHDVDAALDATGVADGDRAYNLTWHDWLNLKSLLAVSKAVTHAALARTDSRGAHFREDRPERGALAASTYTVVRMRDGMLATAHAPVRFTRLAPPAP